MGTLLYIHDVKSSSSKIERFCYQDLFLKLRLHKDNKVKRVIIIYNSIRGQIITYVYQLGRLEERL